MDRFVKVGIETELALRVGPAAASVVYPLSRHGATSIVEGAQLAFEIIDNRYADLPGMDGPARIADDFLQAGCVLGAEVEDWHALDLAQLQGDLYRDGEAVASCAADAAFDALAAFTFVANLLAELGTPLRGGEFVLTGSLHKPYFLERPGRYRASVVGVGQVEVAFV